MSSIEPDQSTPHLFGTLLRQAFELAQTELRLFRAELSERVTATVRAMALLAAALVLSLGTMLLLLETKFVHSCGACFRCRWKAAT